MAALALPSQSHEDLMLAATPIRAGIEMQNLHRSLAYTIEAEQAMYCYGKHSEWDYVARSRLPRRYLIGYPHEAAVGCNRLVGSPENSF